MREAQELSEPTFDYFAQPLEDNLFEWHFTVRGPEDTDFEGGIYHGRIILPTEYPMKPPHIIVLTPNGRFETGTKICLSISGHHPESWQPSWSIRTALLAIIGFMPTPGQGSIGSLDCPPEERRRLARRSVSFECQTCAKRPVELLAKSKNEGKGNNDAGEDTREEARKIAQSMAFKGEDEVKAEKAMLDQEGQAAMKNNGKASNLSEEEEKAKSERKKASLAAQQRFREKLRLRTGGYADPKPEISSSAPVSSSANASQPAGNQAGNPAQANNNAGTVRQQVPVNRPQQQQQQQEVGSFVFSDICIIIIVFVIALLILRRINWMAGIETVDPK